MYIPQCASEADKSKCKQIARQWISKLNDGEVTRATRNSGDLWVRRYFMMTFVEREVSTGPTNEIATVLCPRTDSDTRETALWLNDLLGRIHGKVC